jgi:hypothetical protein
MARTIPVGPASGGPGYILITCPSGGGVTPVDSVMVSNNTGVHQGQMVGFKAKVLPCDNAVDFTLGIKDRDGDTIYTSGAQTSHAANTLIHVVMSLNVPIIEREIITITPAGEPGASGLIVLATLYYNPDADIIAWGYR